MYNFKDEIEDYTEREFIELLGEFTNPTGDNAQLKGEELDKYWDDLEAVSYTTSDAADDTPCVDLGGRRIIKKKKNNKNTCTM